MCVGYLSLCIQDSPPQFKYGADFTARKFLRINVTPQKSYSPSFKRTTVPTGFGFASLITSLRQLSLFKTIVSQYLISSVEFVGCGLFSYIVLVV